MGLNIGTLTKILLGCGLGIIIVSCLTVVVVFGKFVNGFSKYDKLRFIFSFDGSSEMYSSSLAITVLGCFAFVTALAALLLTFIIEDKTLILIIVGAVSAFFTFGCIIAEGLFTKYDQQYEAKHNYNFRYYFNDDDGYHNGFLMDEYNHKGVQDHIKESIEELYNVAYKHFKKAEEDGQMEFDKTIPEWSDFKKKLSQVDSNNRVITYSNIWKGEYDSDFITLHTSSSYIYATFDSKRVYIAYTAFTKNTTYTPKEQLCVYNSDRTDFTCKIYDLPEVLGKFDVLYDFPLTEKIIVGD